MQIVTGNSIELLPVDTKHLMETAGYAPRQKCPNTEFFWSVLSRIWTEYGKIQITKTPYFVAFDAATLFKIIFFNR